MTKQQPKPFPIRMTEEVKQWIESQAKANARSMNAEINRLLKMAMETASKAA
ncbi:MAG: Arc family DNA-binding protein [Thiothrix sp.]|nr:MAG: Arc family DNA-binding protein [Thiothrix sp.]